jgi:hypothetical protein
VIVIQASLFHCSYNNVYYEHVGWPKQMSNFTFMQAKYELWYVIMESYTECKRGCIVGFCEHGNASLGSSVRGGRFTDKLSDY